MIYAVPISKSFKFDTEHLLSNIGTACKFARVRAVVAIAYEPHGERSVNENESSWSILNGMMERFREQQLCVMRNKNSKVEIDLHNYMMGACRVLGLYS